MKYIKELPNKFVNFNKEVGEVSFPDGLVDITDPGYNRDTWCARYDFKVLPGVYKAFIDEVDFPSVWEAEDSRDAEVYNVKVGDVFTVNDPRIMSLVIVHKNYEDAYQDGELNRYVLGKNIGVDAGLCGFYNHKPDFNDEEWNRFWQSLSKTESGNDCDCTHANGVTVRSGFGDGMYTVYKLTYNRKVVGLELRF